MARIVAAANQKGGVGKTTTVVNFAAVLSEKGYRVLLVDSDPQGNASASCGVEDTDVSLYDVYAGAHVQQVIQQTQHGFDVIPDNGNLAAVESQLMRQDDRSETKVLQQALEPVQAEYDFILIDLPPSLGMLTINGLVAAGEVFIPLTPEVLPLHGVQEILDTIWSINGNYQDPDALNPRLRCIGALFTKYKANLKLHQEVRLTLRQLFDGYSIRVMGTAIKDCVRFAEAPARKKPAVLLDKKTPAVQDYHRLAAEVFCI